MLKKHSWVGISLLLLPVGWAYIDPGTGSIIAGSIWPLIISILVGIGAFFSRYFMKPIKNAVGVLWKKIKEKKSG